LVITHSKSILIQTIQTTVCLVQRQRELTLADLILRKLILVKSELNVN